MQIWGINQIVIGSDTLMLTTKREQNWPQCILMMLPCYMLSMDDMSKIKLGAQAVSRYHQIKIFFMINYNSILSNHDFPVPSYLLRMSGYIS